MILREASLDDAPAIARVHVDTWRKTYQGIVPEDYLAKLSYEKRENRWVEILNSAAASGQFTLVAEAEPRQIIGFANGGLERTGDTTYKGELNAIYILDTYQRQGIGRRLTLAVVDKLAQANIHSILVWVLADNPACSFYEALGGHKVYAKQTEIGGARLNELAYGWTDTRVLIHGLFPELR